MSYRSPVLLLLLTALCSPFAHSDLIKDIKKAVERSTLDQPGTKPFHLKAAVAPSFERDKDSGRTAEIEIWWASPTQWRRELTSPNFHRVEIHNANHSWQKNDGDYFPQWLQQTALELVTPAPPLDEVLDQAKTAEPRQLGRMTNLAWVTSTGTSEVHNISRSSLALDNKTGLLLYDGGLGWGAEFKDYSSFHSRMVARTVNVGSPQVTAKVTVLEDLAATPPAFFDAAAPTGDPQVLQTVLIDEPALLKNLLPAEPISWPPLQDGVLQGNFTTEIVVDRDGKVREIGTLVSENSGIYEAGKHAVEAMRFKPFLQNGVPVQVLAQITIPWKTTRPTGTETFDSARTFFERGRHAGFPAAGNTPYILRANFEARSHSGDPAKGHYEDTFLSETQWRREAWFGESHYARMRNGDKSYQISEGPDASVLQFVFRILEPIPALGTFQESDWRIKRDTVNGVRAIRVLTGYESPEGQLDPEQVRGFWFDDAGTLLKTYFQGVETQRAEFLEFAGVRIAHQIDVLKGNNPAMHIHITEVIPAPSFSPKMFEAPKHEWTRAFTDQTR